MHDKNTTNNWFQVSDLDGNPNTNIPSNPTPTPDLNIPNNETASFNNDLNSSFNSTPNNVSFGVNPPNPYSGDMNASFSGNPNGSFGGNPNTAFGVNPPNPYSGDTNTSFSGNPDGSFVPNSFNLNGIDYSKSILQIKTYTRKFFRILKKESLVSILIGIVITLLVMIVTSDKMFETFEGTKSGLFALICVCIWIGIFNSIQLVCREKNDIVKDELDKGLRASSYMAAHFIYQAILCAIQSLIVFFIFLIFVNSDLEGNALLYLIVIYMVMFTSDAMAFVISAAVPTPIVAMTVMPLLLLIQLVMAGVMFELKGFSEFLSYFTVSRWGISAFGMIGDIGTFPSAIEAKLPAGVELTQKLSSTDKALYDGNGGDIFVCILMFILFTVLFYFLSVMALKLTTKRIKK